MKKLTDQDPETKSPDLVAENIERLKALFPEAFTEGKVDFEVLKQLLGDAVDEREEKYGLNWHGKRRARQIALIPSTGTLRPCLEDSVNWNTTQNLMIEGDNLEVLKLLQKSYHKRIKMIYIDPPYNTGGEFIYGDDFRDNIKNYMELTGQTDEVGRRLAANAETSGRYHTNWLNMMYPRLKIARNLLRDDGVIFISIDDTEAANLRKICDEIFGEENFIANVVWQKKQSPQNDATYLSDMHDHILVFAKMAKSNKTDANGWSRLLLPRDDGHNNRYTNTDNDPRGAWASVDCTCNKTSLERPNLYYPIVNPNTGKEVLPSTQRVWRYEKSTMQQLLNENRIWWGDGGDNFPRQKRFLTEVQNGVVPSTWWSREFASDNQAARRELRTLFNENEGDFSTPKPIGLIRRMLQISTETKDIVLDFFSGSSTTAHAVLALNSEDGSDRKFIMIQIPEPCDNESEAFKAGYKTIADIGKERIRRVIRKLESGQAEKEKKAKEKLPGIAEDKPDLDLGFRVFKLASSNISAWEPDRENLPKTLQESAEHLKTDRTEQDILFELLLKLGLDLTVPIEQKTIARKAVHSIGAGTLFVCLAPQIAAAEVEPLALGIISWHKQLAPAGETQVVFRDSAFADDVAKTNLTAILQQHGLESVRSL